MHNVFEQMDLYPDNGSIKSHFNDLYQSVFIAFLPFYKIADSKIEVDHFKKSRLTSLADAKENNESLRNLDENVNRDIYVYDNKNYPTDRDIFEKGVSVPWEIVWKGSGLKNECELNNALLTSIGALKEKYSTPQLTVKLDRYTSREHIWHPVEGAYDILTRRAIYRVFRLLGKHRIVITEEFFERSKICEINTLTEFDFCEQIRGKDYYIYSEDKEILFTIDWDSFFFLIASSQEKMVMIQQENVFEGFYCDSETTHSWSLNPVD